MLIAPASHCEGSFLDQPVTHARHLARLVWLLLHEPDNIDDQKATLRLLVAASRDESVNLALHGNALQANDRSVPSSLAGVRDFVTQMSLHGLSMVTVDENPLAADLLSVARMLAAMPTPDDGGMAIEEKRRSLGVTTIRFAARPRFSNENQAARVSDAPAAEFDFGEVYDDPIAEALSRATPRSTVAIPAPTNSEERHGGLFAQFAAARTPKAPPEVLLRELDDANDGNAIGLLLDDLTVLTEAAAREGKGDLVIEIMGRAARRARSVEDPEAKRVIALSLRRLAKPAVLHELVRHLPHTEGRRPDIMAALSQIGDEGIGAVITQLSEESSQRDRRVYFDALIELHVGVPTLVRMLDDSRWYVARNGADLLGELHARDAEIPLTALLKHEDDRVRRSSSGALMRLGTPRAIQAIQGSLADAAPHARIDAAAAIASRKDSQTTATLLRALDVEKDAEVQAAFLLALGKIASSDAIERLVRSADADHGLFKKKSAASRVAAIKGLGEARTPAAMDALRGLQGDKDDDVRAAATFALGRIARRSNP